MKIIIIAFIILLIPAFVIAASEQQKAVQLEKKTPGTQSTDAQNIEKPKLNTINLKVKQKGIIDGLTTELTTEKDDNDDEDNNETPSPRAIQRRSRVSNAVQTMLQISEENQGIGQQIRIIAQNQNREMEEIEEGLQSVKQRSRFVRFLIGPKYGQISSIEERLEQNNGRLEELKQLKDELPEEDAKILDVQIQAMQEVKKELQSELDLEEASFSLFGWLVKLFTK